MPRPANFDSLSRDDLLVAVRELVAQGRVKPQEVRAAADRAKRIAELETELARLRAEGNGAPTRSAGRPRAAPPTKAKRQITNTPKRQAALRRQGQYLAALKKLKGSEATRLRALAQEEGVPAALKLAERLLS